MFIERLKRTTRPAWEPVMRRLDDIAARLERVEGALSALDEQGRQTELRASVESLRDDVWHSKVVNVGDRLLVGSRHLGMVFLVQMDDRLIGPRFIVDGEYEPDTTAFVLKTVRPDSVCIDVGANFGYYTCLMARLSWLGRTIAFEPDPEVFSLLRDNVHINWCESVVEYVNAAVGRSTGPLTLHRHVGRSGNTSIVQMTSDELDKIGEGPSEEFTVDCVRLDDYADRLDRVDLVKVDVEGAETLVLAGMHALVKRHRPTVIMEWSPDQTTRAGFGIPELVAQLRELELQPNTVGPGGVIVPVRYDDVAALPYQNLVLTPGPATA